MIQKKTPQTFTGMRSKIKYKDTIALTPTLAGFSSEIITEFRIPLYLVQ